MKNDFVIFLHEMLIGTIVLNIPQIAKFLIENLGISPFYRGIYEKSALHFASESKNSAILGTILNLEYAYIIKDTVVDLKLKVLKERESDGNIGLHFAALRGNLNNFDLLKNVNKKGLEIRNQRILKPHECTRNIDFDTSENMENQKFLENLEKFNETLTQTNSRMDSLVGKVSHCYQYVIVCRDQSFHPQQTLVYNQLTRVNLLKQNKTSLRKSRFLGNRASNSESKGSNQNIYKDRLVIGGDNVEEDELFIGGEGADDKIELMESNMEREVYESQEYEGNLLKVKWIELVDYDEPGRGFYRHCYLVGLNERGKDDIANFLNLKVFNKNKDMPDHFDIKNKSRYENFRYSHLQRMMYFLLEKEFDLDYYTSHGIVESHFFTHTPPQNNHIPGQFFKNNLKLMADNLLPKPSKKNLLNGVGLVNYYFGPNMGLYMGFNNLYSSWLVLLSIVGLITTLLITFLGNGDVDFEGLPVYGIIIIIVITFVDQFWRRRESELVFLWDLRAYSMNEPQRKEHVGKWIIDPISRKIRKKSYLTTFYRRMITEVPIIFLGLFFIIGNYVLFFFLNQKLANSLSKGEISKETAKYYGMLLGAGNGVSISVLNKIYQLAVEGVLSWENHRFESSLKASRIPKLFLFNFCMHYINLFFYAFYLQDFLVLRSNFISLFIIRAASNLALTYGLPIILFWLNKKMANKKILSQWKKRKEAFLKQNVMADKWFFDLAPSIQNETKIYERELYLWNQIEHSILRPAPLDLTLIWMNQLLQFGFIVFFGVVFPLAPLIGLIFNLLDSYLLTVCSGQVNKRDNIIMLANAGVWTYIITQMTYIALVTNAALFAFVSQGFRELVDVSGDYKLLLMLVLSEHVILAIKILLTLLISDVPKWVSIEIKHRKTKKQMYLQSENERNILNQLKANLFKNKQKKNPISAPVFDDVDDINLMLDGVKNKKDQTIMEVIGNSGIETEILQFQGVGDTAVNVNAFDLQAEEELENALIYGEQKDKEGK
jgi:hypothetical protein